MGHQALTERTLLAVQMQLHKGLKVFSHLLLHLDEEGRAQLLGEVITTVRDYTALLGTLTFMEQQLSRLYPPGPRDSTMAAKGVMPGYTMTDRDLATLNVLCRTYNGMK